MLRIRNIWRSPIPLVNLSNDFCFNRNFSCSLVVKSLGHADRDCEDFLPWLESKAGARISSLLSVRKSEHGRSLFATKEIKRGDCILEVPYSVQITPYDLPPKLVSYLPDTVGNIAKLAIVVLVEQKKSQDSEWARYIECLPNPCEMHSTMFWSKGEMGMIHASSVYHETINKKDEIQMEFKRIIQHLEKFPELLGSMTFGDFMHAYFAVESRAWESTSGFSLIPFADFLNHDGTSNAILESYEARQISEVIADRNYALGEEGRNQEGISGTVMEKGEVQRF